MVIGILIGILIGGAGSGAIVGGIATHQGNKHNKEHLVQVDQLQADKQVLAADLAECRAKVTPESITATGKVLQAAQAGELADTQLRGALVAAIPQTAWADAVIKVGSPQLTATAAEMASCHAANTTGDSGRSGCADQVPKAWAAAVASLASCPDLGESF